MTNKQSFGLFFLLRDAIMEVVANNVGIEEMPPLTRISRGKGVVVVE